MLHTHLSGTMLAAAGLALAIDIAEELAPLMVVGATLAAMMPDADRRSMTHAKRDIPPDGMLSKCAAILR
ncbi:MAG: hypothetical protein ACR2HO_04845 [Rubrobacteraceae bacterium]